MAEKPYRFRAVHTRNSWRKAAHETFERATTLGNRSALALFEHRNDAINYAKEGEPLYVVVWHKDYGDGLIFKPDSNAPSGMRRSSVVPRSVVEDWENLRRAPEDELERYFAVQSRLDTSSESLGQSEDVDFESLKTLDQVDDRLAIAIKQSTLLSRKARLQRLQNASKSPPRIEVSTYAFIRNPDVIVEVLMRADGQCERCGSSAPFKREKDGSPYLEVHHIIQLSQGGEDTVSNAQALCPNCHRYLHYGQLS